MPALKTDQLNAQIESNKIGGMYLFDGPENWLKEKAVQAIIKKLLPEEAQSFNLDQIDGNTAPGSAIINAAMSLPWMSERRVVIVRQAEELSTAESKAIGEILSDVPSSTCLVFLYDERASLREEIPAQVGSLGSIVTFWTPFPNQWPAIVTQEARQHSKTISFEAARLLSDACEDLQQMAMEMSKLVLFIGDKKNIEIEDLRRHGLPEQEGDYDDLEAAIWSRDPSEALRQAHRMMESGVQPASLMAVFERIFRQIILGHYHRTEQKMDWEDLYSALRFRGRTQQENIQKGLRNYAAKDVKNSLEAITQADYEIKTGALPPTVAVTLLLLKLCGGKPDRMPERAISRFS